MSPPDITLYHAPGSRSSRVIYLLEELALPYKVEVVSTPEARATPEYRAIHPLGQIPAITDAGTPIYESGAILQYINDRYGAGKLSPPVDSAERGLYLQWLTYGENTLTIPASLFGRHTFRYAPEKRIPAVAATGAEDFKIALGVIEKALEGKDWLLGSKFTTADIVVGAGIRQGNALGLVTDEFPNAKAYLARFQARPAYAKAFPA